MFESSRIKYFKIFISIFFFIIWKHVETCWKMLNIVECKQNAFFLCPVCIYALSLYRSVCVSPHPHLSTVTDSRLILYFCLLYRISCVSHVCSHSDSPFVSLSSSLFSSVYPLLQPYPPSTPYPLNPIIYRTPFY